MACGKYSASARLSRWLGHVVLGPEFQEGA